MKKNLIVFSLFLVMFLSLNVDVSNAGISSGYVAKGYWIRGVSGTSLQSRFTAQKSAQGHASTIDGEDQYVSGGWKPKYVESNGSQYTIKSGNLAYFNWR